MVIRHNIKPPRASWFINSQAPTLSVRCLSVGLNRNTLLDLIKAAQPSGPAQSAVLGGKSNKLLITRHTSRKPTQSGRVSLSGYSCRIQLATISSGGWLHWRACVLTTSIIVPLLDSLVSGDSRIRSWFSLVLLCCQNASRTTPSIMVVGC
jgi:hypothetical protein